MSSANTTENTTLKTENQYKNDKLRSIKKDAKPTQSTKCLLYLETGFGNFSKELIRVEWCLLLDVLLKITSSGLSIIFLRICSWNNHGTTWHIDHVLLCHLFDHNDPKDREICFNWKNTRPLPVKTNLARKQLDSQDLLCHEIKLHYFEKNNMEGYNHITYDFAYLTTKLLEKSCSGSS